MKCTRICLECIRYYMLVRIMRIIHEPLMIIIALVLALVENQRQPGHGWICWWCWWMWLATLWRKGLRQQVQNQKLVSKFYKLLQSTNQTGNVKGVGRTHEGKSLIMTISWSGKSKKSHTMWVCEFYTAFIEKCVMPALCCYELSSRGK